MTSPIADDRPKFWRCKICGAYHGQRVWRLISNWRCYAPGPLEYKRSHRDDETPAAVTRDEQYLEFITSSGLYHQELQRVNVGKKDACAWCAKHLKKEPTLPCPRCSKGVFAEFGKCPLCNGNGVIAATLTAPEIIARVSHWAWAKRASDRS